MSDDATATAETKAVVKYRNSGLRSLQKELSAIEKSLPENEPDAEYSNDEKPETQKTSRWQRAFQHQDTSTNVQLGTETSGLNTGETACYDDAAGFRGDAKSDNYESDNESDNASNLSSRGRDNDSLSLSFSMSTGEFSSLTEAERLEKQLEILEKRIEKTKERIQEKGRTNKQREADRSGLKRMKAKLEKLEMRIQNEVSGKKRWSLVRKEIRKPTFGLNTLNSVDFLRRKRALAEANGLDFPRRRAPRLTTIVEQAVAKNIEDKLKQKRALLRRIQQKIEEDDTWVQLGLYGAKTLDPVIEEEFHAQMKDEREFRDGWLRISDVREDFMRSIGFYGGNDDRGVKTSQRHMWQKYADRGHDLKTDPLNERPCSRNKQSKDGLIHSRDQWRCSSSAARLTPSQSKPLPELYSKGRKLTETSPSVKEMVDYKKVLTTSFLPKIPSPESRRRPPTADIEKLKDDKDDRLKREKIRLVPNRKRVAENRARLFMAQMDFAKTHNLSSKGLVESLSYAIEDCGHTPTGILAEQPCSISRDKLFLIGALSKDHLRPPGERNVRAKSV